MDQILHTARNNILVAKDKLEFLAWHTERDDNDHLDYLATHLGKVLQYLDARIRLEKQREEANA